MPEFKCSSIAELPHPAIAPSPINMSFSHRNKKPWREGAGAAPANKRKAQQAAAAKEEGQKRQLTGAAAALFNAQQQQQGGNRRATTEGWVVEKQQQGRTVGEDTCGKLFKADQEGVDKM